LSEPSADLLSNCLIEYARGKVRHINLRMSVPL
jgi:hypothetical protein